MTQQYGSGGGSGGSPSGPAGGDLAGTYPNPLIAPGADGTVLTSQSGDADWIAPAGGPPSGAAGGDLTGTYPNPTIAALAVTAAKVAAANKDGTAGTASMRTLGTGATQATAGNDARLSDSRAPNGAAGGDLTGTYPNPTIAALAVTDAAVATANKDGASATPSMRTLGTGAAQATAGNDSRLSDARTPTGSAGGVLGGTYPNPTFATNGTTPILGTVSAQLGAAVNISSANTSTDILSVSLTAGTWLILACALFKNGAGATNGSAKLWDGTTVMASEESVITSGSNTQPLPLMGVYTTAGTPTIKISAYSSDTVSQIAASTPQNGVGNNSTYIVALRIA